MAGSSRSIVWQVCFLACVLSVQCLLVERSVRANSQQLIKRSKFASGHAIFEGRHRRETQTCGLTESDMLDMEPQELNEKAESIQAVWVGHDEILIVASDKVLSGHSTVWRGTFNPSLGIMKFESNNKAIGVPVFADSLQVSPAGNRATVVVVSLNRRYLYVSRDYAKTFDQYKTPTVDFNPTEELYLSNFNPQHMVVRSQSGELYVSDNWGKNWHFITSHVRLVEFAEVGKNTEYVYYSVSSDSDSFNPLYRLDIAGRDSRVIDHSAYRFRVDDRYLFVSRKNSTGNKVEDAKSRRLYVTNDYGSEKVTFSEVQLPSLQDEQYYVVMATHESGAFIHVYQGSDGVSGNLYVSDSSGSQFTLSLSNHLYQVFNHPMGHYSVYDFYEVVSMRGVYITTAVDPAVNGHVTKITFDNGGLWSTLTPPTGACSVVGSGACSLHLHLRYTQLVSPFFNSSSPKGPLSIASAPMIIVAHGTVGRVRNDTGQDTKVYVSNDGGYTWKDPGLPFGTYVYGIADYGNIIAIAPDGDYVQKLWFSHDRGNCFVERTVDVTGYFQLSRGLLFDPSAASLLGYVMGVQGTGVDDEWRVVTLNFRSLLRRPCLAKDYVATVEHSANKNCLMGYKYSYNLTNANSICYNAEGYNYHPVAKVPCPCNYSDYECDYGFTRTSVTTCSAVEGISLADACPPGEETYQQSTSGFRQIPGDSCSPTDESRKLLSKETLYCSGHEKDSGYVVVSTHSAGVTIFFAILIVIVSIIAASIMLYLWLKCRAKNLVRDRVYYQRLPKEDKFAVGNDSSDEDLITAT